MNSKIIGVILALIILLLAGGAYFLSQNKSSTQTNQSVTPTKAEGKSSSLLNLLTQGGNQRCSFKSSTSKTSTEGTVYISGGKIRGDFKTTIEGKVQEMSMIRNGDMNYIWGPSLPTGIKMKVSLEDLSKNQQAGQFVNTNEKLNYNCMPWSTDSSLFTPPANIKFSELPNSLIPKTTGTGTGTGTKTNTQNPSSYCDQLTDASAKAACVNAMNGQ